MHYLKSLLKTTAVKIIFLCVKLHFWKTTWNLGLCKCGTIPALCRVDLCFNLWWAIKPVEEEVQLCCLILVSQVCSSILMLAYSNVITEACGLSVCFLEQSDILIALLLVWCFGLVLAMRVKGTDLPVVMQLTAVQFWMSAEVKIGFADLRSIKRESLFWDKTLGFGIGSCPNFTAC